MDSCGIIGRERIGVVKEELERLLRCEELKHAPVLVLANKQVRHVLHGQSTHMCILVYEYTFITHVHRYTHIHAYMDMCTWL